MPPCAGRARPAARPPPGASRPRRAPRGRGPRTSAADRARVPGNGGFRIEFVPFAIFIPPHTPASGSSQNSQSSTVRPPFRILRYTVWPDIRCPDPGITFTVVMPPARARQKPSDRMSMESRARTSGWSGDEPSPPDAEPTWGVAVHQAGQEHAARQVVLHRPRRRGHVGPADRDDGRRPGPPGRRIRSPAPRSGAPWRPGRPGPRPAPPTGPAGTRRSPARAGGLRRCVCMAAPENADGARGRSSGPRARSVGIYSMRRGPTADQDGFLISSGGRRPSKNTTGPDDRRTPLMRWMVAFLPFVSVCLPVSVAGQPNGGPLASVSPCDLVFHGPDSRYAFPDLPDAPLPRRSARRMGAR